MKTQTITLTHLPDILLVVLPEEAKEYHITQDYQGSYLCWDDGTTDFERQQFGDHGQFKFCDNPRNNWRIVSTLAEVSEKDAKNWVRYIGGWGYINYNVKTQIKETLLKTALESFHSAIRDSGWYLDNPHGEEPKPDNTPNYAYSIHARQWEQAQSRVLCRERCLVLRRVE